MIKKILAILAAIGTFFSAIFFVLFKQANEEKKAEREKSKNLNTNLEAVKAGDKAEKELKKENEELIEQAHSGNNIDTFNACNSLLSK